MDFKKVFTWAKRIFIWLLGFYILGLGVAISRKALLGVTPVTSIANVVYEIMKDKTPMIKVGNWVTIAFICYMIVTMLILRREYKPVMLLQIVGSFIFGAFVNSAVDLISFINTPDTYAMKFVFLLISIPVTALGVWLYLRAGVLPLPGEGVSLAVSKKTGLSISTCKTMFDTSIMLASVITSLLYFRTFVQVREGTVIASLLVGPTLKVYDRLLGKQLDKFLDREENKTK